MKGNVIIMATPKACKKVLPGWSLTLNIKGAKTRPTTVKASPPQSSCFHAKIRRPVKANEGIRCIKKPASFCQNVLSPENASNAKRLMKIIARMPSIRGLHHKNRLLYFMFISYSLFLLFICAFGSQYCQLKYDGKQNRYCQKSHITCQITGIH